MKFSKKNVFLQLQDAGKQEPDDDIQRHKEKEEPAQPDMNGPDLHSICLCTVPEYAKGKSYNCKEEDHNTCVRVREPQVSRT